MKTKIIALAMAAILSLAVTGCGGQESPSTTATPGTSPSESPVAQQGTIVVVSREEGSGTRGAFVELMGIEAENEDGETMDMTTLEAIQAKSTSVMLTTVEGNKDAIGYISLGAMQDSVKSVKIDGVEATVENIKNGTYKVSRPFNIATKENVSALAQDFISFIMSADGQQVIEDEGYIKVAEDASAYTKSEQSGKITIAGSSSVTPVMEKLKEAYIALYPDVTIEIQETDSSAGMISLAEGVCDIGMASRELKASETEQGLTPTVIALDGIAVIVNNENAVDDLTSEQVKAIYTGETTDWSALN